MSKNKFKKGFTIIELIVVIAILGILVLLAAPKFLGYTEKAKVVQIQSDIKGLETAINSKLLEDPELLKGEPPVSNDTIKGYQAKSTLYHIAKDNPVVSNQDGLGGVFYEVNSDLMKKVGFKSNLKGKFYYSEDDNKVYFNRDKSNDSGVVDEGIPYAKDSDFTWVNDSDGYNVTSQATKGYYKYTGTSEVVRIPHKINGDSITSYYKMFYSNTLPSLTVISDNINITNMNSMFSSSKATTLDVSKLDTSNVTNMRYMFSNSSATTIDVSKFDTSKVTNMNSMFSSSKATTLDVSKLDTSNVTNMGRMFYASKATTLDVSNFNTSNVTDMSEMFQSSQATTLDVSNFNTSNVTNMFSMFQSSQAKTLDLSNFDTSNVEDMFGMFQSSQATTLDVSNFNTSNVTRMSSMFGFSKATILDLSSFDTSNVTDMSYMFENSLATTGYARTEAEADKFNSTSDKPDSLTFKVK